MTPKEFELVKKLFGAVVELPLGEQNAYLAEQTAPTSVIEKVKAMLAVEDSPDNPIEKNRIDIAGTLAREVSYADKYFGAYRILREIGSGGMGSVFLAERDDNQFKMQVALKIVRQAIADSGLIARFKRERQILAGLNHPNIATLHDGGVSENGEPFLAMEYVEGSSLLHYCDENKLDIRSRLIIFLKICSGVAYAHRNLVVHRDIKPSNILVTSNGEPKLLDFGLAKALDSTTHGGETTTLRAFTPAYASPEQIKGETITTASDVYSLGVVLYELLTGAKPLDVDNKSYDQIIGTVSNVEPVRPSLASGTDNSDKKLNALRGDLDTIVLTAIRKEPERRYRSVEALSNDIEHYLDGFPIEARPNTFGYRVSKFIRRNKVMVVATAMIVATLVTGLSLTYRQYRETQSQMAKADEVKTFLQQMLLTANPDRTIGPDKGSNASINKMLEYAASRLETDFSGQPEVRFELERIIGEVYHAQGQFDLSEKYMLAAIRTGSQVFADDSIELLLARLAYADIIFGKAVYPEAGPLYEKYLPSFRDAFRAGKIAAPAFRRSLNNYGLLRRALGRSREAEALYRESIGVLQNIPGSERDLEHTETLLALTLLDQGKFDETESMVRNLVASSRRDSENMMGLANSLTLLGSVLMEKGETETAMTTLTEGETIYRRLYSPQAIPIFDNLRLQAQVSYLQGDLAKARSLIIAVLENYRQYSSPSYISFATALTVEGEILARLGRLDAAEASLREADRLRRANFPQGHFLTALTAGALGECLLDRGNVAEARPLLEESFKILTETQGESNPRTAKAAERLRDLNEIELKGVK